MADNTSATDGANGQGQNSSDTATDQQTAGQQTQSDTSTDSKQTEGKITFTPEQQAWINSLVKTEKEKEVNKAKSKWEADSKLSEDEKLKNDLAEARAALQERDSRDFVKEAAKKAGVNNPNLFYEANKSKFERNDKGEITNLDSVIADSKTDFPELFINTAAINTGSADAGEGKDTPATLTREQVEAMTPEQINQNRDAVNAFLATLK